MSTYYQILIVIYSVKLISQTTSEKEIVKQKIFKIHLFVLVL